MFRFYDPLINFIILSPYLFLFLIGIFLAFYIPGSIFLKKEKLGFFEFAILSIGIGMALWVFQGFVFGFLNLRFLTYIYLIVTFVIWLKSKKRYVGFKFQIDRFKILLILIFSLGIFVQAQQFFASGSLIHGGFYTFSSANDDAMLHTSYILQLVKNFPPQEPGMNGVVIKNYHFLSNLEIAEFIRIFHIPLFAAQYYYFYIFISFMIGAASYTFARIIGLNKLGIISIVYLQYFASDTIYLLTFLTKRAFDFSVHPLVDGTMFLENPPRAFSFVLLFILFSLIFLWFKNQNKKLGLSVALVAGCLVGFKVHTGVPVMLGMVFLGFAFLVKRQWSMIWVPILAGIISLIIYIPINFNAGSLLYVPFELTRTFAAQENLKISNFELARRVYMDHNNFIQAFRMDLTMLLLFIVFQFGLNTIGFIPLYFSHFRKYFLFYSFILSIAFSSALLGTLFLQPIAHMDIFNFYLTFNFILIIFASLNLNYISNIKFRFVKVIIIIIIVAMAAPRIIQKTLSVNTYFNSPKASISKSEIDAMEFVKKNTPKTSLVLATNKNTWDSMYPYVSVFTDRDMFLSGQVMMDRHGINYSERQKIVNNIYNEKNPETLGNILSSSNIDILYEFKGASQLLARPAFYKKIFENEVVMIYSRTYEKQ